jgi:hypothetical protein
MFYVLSRMQSIIEYTVQQQIDNGHLPFSIRRFFLSVGVARCLVGRDDGDSILQISD